jgi:hypothetical protein
MSLNQSSPRSLEGIPECINRRDRKVDGSQPPRVEVSEAGRRAIEMLSSAMKRLYDKYGVVIIRNVRQFNKNLDDQQKWIQKIREENIALECCAGTFATIIQTSEKPSFNSESALEEAKRKLGDTETGNIIVPLQISVMNEGEKFWTAGLNGPTAIVRVLSEAANIPLDRVIILNQTHEVQVDKKNLSVMHDNILRSRLPITVRITPGNLYRDKENQGNGVSADTLEAGREMLIDALVRAIRAMHDGARMEIDRHLAEIIITLDRNTLGLHRLSTLVEQGGAHPASNGFLGMEDTRSQAYTLLSIYKREGQEGLLSFLQEHFSAVVSYHDDRMDAIKNVDIGKELDGDLVRAFEAQRKKIRDEVLALARQFSGQPESFQRETVVPKGKRDFII